MFVKSRQQIKNCWFCTIPIKQKCPYWNPGTQNLNITYLVILHYEFYLVLYLFDKDRATNKDFRSENVCEKGDK